MPPALRSFIADHPALAVTARARIEQRRKEYMEQLGTAYASSWEDYLKRAGVIRGLDEALELIAIIEKEIMEGGR